MSRFIPLDTHPTQTLDGTDSARSATHTLPEGARLGRHEVVGCIGEGGFGIVYLAWDPTLAQHVAIKEYLPALLASRASASPSVVVKSQRHLQRFRDGLRSFVNEARTLAQFDHPALVKVLDFWEANGTAYMVMPYHVGPTLGQALEDLGRAPDEAELRQWIEPLLDALDTLHAADCVHRDIAPDNILLTQTGPVLLDFGAARRVLEGAGLPPTAIFKPGFTPIEQYGQAAAMRQGAWTDLYALASVVHAAITGAPPAPSVERLMDDRQRPLAVSACGRYGTQFLQAIDAALALHPAARPQSVAAFRERMGRLAPPVAAAPVPVPVTRAPGGRKVGLRVVAGGAAFLVAVALYFGRGDPAPPAALPLPPVAVEVPVPMPVPVAAPIEQLTPPAPPPPPAPVPVAAAPLPLESVRPVARREPRKPAMASRCAELLQRASLEPLAAGQAAFLQKECER